MIVHVDEMVGKKFGKLTVRSLSEPNKYGHAMFLCLCDCGRETITLKSSLTRPTKGTTSCGCKKFFNRTRKRDWKIDSTIGYTKENTTPCCSTCNFAKNNLTLNEFKTWLTRAYNHLIVK